LTGLSAAGRYQKISHGGRAIEALFTVLFLEAHAQPPEQIIPDLDAMDKPLHGHQEGRFFHGYCDGDCYLTLCIFCAPIPASAGTNSWTVMKTTVSTLFSGWPARRT
jgi:hypothetical protein